jgi:hypothetical protein
MFFRDKLSNILRTSPGADPGKETVVPAITGGALIGALSGGGTCEYKPTPEDSNLYRSRIRELETEIDKQRKRKKNSLIFLGIGIFCTVLLGVGLFTHYGPNTTTMYTAMESLRDAKGGALGLETAQLAFGFSTVGFLIPIAMTVISLIVGLASNNKINKSKKEKALYNELMLGLSSSNPKIQMDRELQNATAVLRVEDKKVQNWQDKVKKARSITNTSSNQCQ